MNKPRNKTKPETTLLSNGGTIKQLLARSHYILYKNRSNWTEKQNEKTKFLIELYGDIEKAHGLDQNLRSVFTKATDKI